MSDLIPRYRVPYVAAWLAAQGRDLLTAPASLLTLALSEPWGPVDDRDVGDGPREAMATTTPPCS